MTPRVYKVYDGKIESVGVEKKTDKRIWLVNRVLAFGCRGAIAPSEAHWSPEDAVAAYVAERMATIDKAQREVDAARAWLATRRGRP